MNIKQITAREILDSRGLPTIEAKLFLDNGESVYAQAPSGESMGKFEGSELRDRGETRYDGMGVLRAASYITDLIGPKLTGVDVTRQADIDTWLLRADGSNNSSKLGVNTIMTVSQLVLKAAALAHRQPIYQYFNHLYNAQFEDKINIEKIPSPVINMINGGKHGTKNLEFQEFHIIPSTSLTFSKALELSASLYQAVKNVLEYRNAGISVSEEGGFTPNLLTNSDALEVMRETIVSQKMNLGVDVFFGLDCAPSFYYKKGKYSIKDAPQPLSLDEYIDFMVELVNKYTILFLEDPIDEEDYGGWKKIIEKTGEKTYVVGDDFVSGNHERLEKAIKEQACNSILVKFNQVPTITDILTYVNTIKKAQYKVVFSHRLGETTDSLIADLAVAIQADFVKFGAPVRGERVVKYNRLLEIEKELLS